MALWILIGILVLIIAWFVAAYNGLVSLRNQVKNAWAQIDVQLKRRYDLIPNLVETVKSYMEYESETLEKVVKARNMAVSASGAKAAGQAEAMVSRALSGMYAVMEKYPDLKANQNVTELMEELTSTENKIAFARQHYNDSVTRYNTKTEVLPTNLIAGSFGFKQEELFEIPETEKEVPKVKLR